MADILAQLFAPPYAQRCDACGAVLPANFRGEKKTHRRFLGTPGTLCFCNSCGHTMVRTAGKYRPLSRDEADRVFANKPFFARGREMVEVVVTGRLIG